MFELKPVTDPHKLYGQQRLLHELLESKNNHAILGEPKQGKTSVLQCLLTLLKEREKPFFYLDSTVSPKTVDITSELFQFLERDLGEERIYILIDDFDTIITDPTVLHPLRSIGEDQNVVYVITSRESIKSHTYQECSPFSNIFMTRHLNNLTLNAVEELVLAMKPSEHENVGRILELTAGHPYLIKLLLNFDNPLENRDFWLTARDFFTYTWAHLSPQEQHDLLECNLYNPSLDWKGYVINYKRPGLFDQWLVYNEPELRECLEKDENGKYWEAFLRGMDFYKKQMEKFDDVSNDIRKLLF